MAGIFSPTQQQALNSAAETFGSIIRDRFETKEAETFQTNELARFFAETAAHNENISIQETPEAMVNSMKQYNHNIFMPFITNASAKYANNSRVMQIVQNIKAANDKQFDQFVDVQKMKMQGRQVGVQEAREERLAGQQQAQEGRAQELFPLQKNQMQAETERTKAQTALLQAQASEAAKDAQPTTFADVLAYARGPKDLKNKLEIDQRTENEIVARILQKNRGQLYPSKVGVWSSDPDSEKQNRTEALDYLRQKGILKDVYTAGRVAAQLGPDNNIAQQLANAGVDQEAISLVFPHAQVTYEDPYRNVKGKIDDKINDQAVVSIITGMPQSAESGFSFNNLEDYYDNSIESMQSYKDLPIPLRRIFDVIQTDKLGNPVVHAGDPETGQLRAIPIEQVKSKEEGDISLESALKMASRNMILNDLVQKDTDQYNKVKGFLDKTIEKFLNEVAIEKSSTLREQLSLQPESFLEMLRTQGVEVPNPINLIKKKGKETKKAVKLLYDWATE